MSVAREAHGCPGDDCAPPARLMNFLLEVDGHMPVVVELQLHLREIYELKVGDLLLK